MKIIKEKSIDLNFRMLDSEGYLTTYSPFLLENKKNSAASAIRKLSEKAQITDAQFETFREKYGITFSYYLLCLLDKKICLSDSKRCSKYLSENYSIKLQEEMFLFFSEVFFQTSNLDKVRFENKGSIICVTAINKYDIEDCLEIEGIKIKELKDGSIYKRELIEKFENKEKELLEEFLKKENLLAEREKLLEQKEEKLLAGFQTSFESLKYKNLNDLQAAKFLTDDEKRIICGLLPKKNEGVKNGKH